MAADPALLPVGLSSLRDRFRDLRPAGPFPAVMGETPHGISERWHQFPPFRGFEGDRCRRVRSSLVFVGEAPSVHRTTWIMADPAPLQRFRDASEEAAAWAPLIRRKVGLPAHPSGTDRESRWWWTVFESAEKGVPGIALRLRHDAVVRRSVDGVIQIGEDDLQRQLADPDSGGDFLNAMLRNAEYSATRFWQLVDIVEASLLLLAVAEAALPEVQAEWAAAADADKRPTDQQPGETKRPGRPRKRDVGGLTLDQWVAAAYAADHARRPWSARQLSEIPGCQWSESAIRTLSNTYKSVQEQLKMEERARADDLREEVVAEEDGTGLHLSKRKSRVGRQRLSVEEQGHEKATEEFLRQHDRKPPRR